MYINLENIIHDSYNYHVSLRNWFSLQENNTFMIYFYIPSNSINILNSSYSLELWATGEKITIQIMIKKFMVLQLSITYSNKKNIYLQYGIAFPTKHTIWNGKDGNSYDGRLDHTTYLRQNAQYSAKDTYVNDEFVTVIDLSVDNIITIELSNQELWIDVYKDRKPNEHGDISNKKYI